MKTILIGILGVMVCGCEKQAERPVDKAGVTLRQAIQERDGAEKRLKALQLKAIDLESQVETLNNRLKIAQESVDLYQRMLDESNARKLAEAKRLLRDVEGK